ncbi:MAG: hypothetical protein AB8U25_05395 [Rickettsiales endosymbiont of Dermacentor nuttalli]
MKKVLLKLNNLLNKHHKAIIIGPGGIGKTKLAKKIRSCLRAKL